MGKRNLLLDSESLAIKQRRLAILHWFPVAIGRMTISSWLRQAKKLDTEEINDEEQRDLERCLEESRQEAEAKFNTQRELLEWYSQRARIIQQRDQSSAPCQTLPMQDTNRGKSIDTSKLFDMIAQRKPCNEKRNDAKGKGRAMCHSPKDDHDGLEIDDLTAWLEEHDDSSSGVVPEVNNDSQVILANIPAHENRNVTPRPSPGHRIPSSLLRSSPPSPYLYGTHLNDSIVTPQRDIVVSDLLASSPPSPLFFEQTGRTASPLRRSNPNLFRVTRDLTVDRAAAVQVAPQSDDVSYSPVDVDRFAESLLQPRRVVALSKRRHPLTVRNTDGDGLGQSVECPICGRSFALKYIERHASNCNGSKTVSEKDLTDQRTTFVSDAKRSKYFESED